MRASISYIDPDQRLWYDACELCTKKVSKENDNFWCHTCQKNVTSTRRYILCAKLIDCTGEVTVTAFNDEAEEILGHTADDLYRLRCQDTEQKSYRAELRKATWVSKIFCLSVLETSYMNRERQRITIRRVTSVDWSRESNLLLQHIRRHH